MNKWTAIYALMCFLLGAIAWVAEASHYHAYLDLRGLLSTSLLVVFLVWVLVLAFTRSWWYRTDLEVWQQFQRTFLLGLVVLLLVPPLYSGSNRWGTAPDAIITTVVFEQEVARYQSRFGNSEATGARQKSSQFLLFFYWENELYRIAYTKGPKFGNKHQGDTIRLPISQGRWGFAWVPIN